MSTPWDAIVLACGFVTSGDVSSGVSTAPSETHLERLAIDGNSAAREIADLRRKADAGDRHAMASLAIACWTESQTDDHRNRSFAWYRQAARNGEEVAPELERRWALVCMRWTKGNPDEQEGSFASGLVAAERGRVGAQVEVAKAFRTGTGVTRDLEQAEHWALAAARTLWAEIKAAPLRDWPHDMPLEQVVALKFRSIFLRDNACLPADQATAERAADFATRAMR